MDKETAERLTKVEIKQQAIEKELDSWNRLLVKIVTTLLGIGAMGFLSGWHISSEKIKTLLEWASK